MRSRNGTARLRKRRTAPDGDKYTLPVRLPAAAFLARITPSSVLLRLAAGPLVILCLFGATYMSPFIALLSASVLISAIVGVRALVFPLFNPNSWAARAAFGERIWANRHAVPLPRNPGTSLRLLGIVAVLGMLVAVLAACLGLALPAVTGLLVSLSSRIAVLNRMAEIYDRHKNRHPLYRSWSVAADNDNRRKSRVSKGPILRSASR